jgi:hypothetical protein
MACSTAVDRFPHIFFEKQTQILPSIIVNFPELADG